MYIFLKHNVIYFHVYYENKIIGDTILGNQLDFSTFIRRVYSKREGNAFLWYRKMFILTYYHSTLRKKKK